MTTDRHGVDHVLDAIDNALWDWTESDDAMTVRYGDNGDGAPGDAAASPGHHTGQAPHFVLLDEGADLHAPRFIQHGVRVLHLDMAQPWTMIPPEDALNRLSDAASGVLHGWHDIGYTTDVPDAFQPEAETEEIYSWAHPMPIRVEQWVPINTAVFSQLPDLSAAFSSLNFGPMVTSLERIREQAAQLGEQCLAATREFGEQYAGLLAQVSENMASSGGSSRFSIDFEVREINQRALELIYGGPVGILPKPDDELTPRERALEARRNRNTGPARNPHRHRGI